MLAIRLVFASIVLFFFTMLGYALFTQSDGVSYSEGERVGVITKLSHKGLFCKTWEGEMNLGGFKNVSSKDNEGRSTTSMVANVFEFSVTDPEIVAQIQEAMNQGETVGLMYSQMLIHNPCVSGTGYIITGVRK